MKRNERGHLEVYFDLWKRAKELSRCVVAHPLDLHFALAGLRDAGVEVTDGEVLMAVEALHEQALLVDGATIRRQLEGG